MLLKDKVAVVTGGGRGIGRAIAKKFASEGASMVVTARSQKEIDEVSAEIRAAGGEASSVVADVSREEDCHKIVDSARQAFGPIHILVNNAGVLGPVRPVEETTTSEWDKVMAVNLRGPFMLSRFVLPKMYEHGSGVILNADSEQLFKQMLNGILQGRPQTTEEIASAALFLVSGHSSAITGQTLNVDGGMAFY